MKRLTARFYMNRLPKAQKLLKAPKMKRPKDKWEKEFKTTLGNLNYFDEGVTLDDQEKEVFYLGELIKKYLKPIKDNYRGEIIKAKISCKNNCIQIERMGQ